MVTTQMKTDAQRLGNGKKAFNVKQVEKMLEDAGGSYTAGTGITIADNTISVDSEIVAMQSDLPDMGDYQEKLTAGAGIDITGNVISYNGSNYTLCTTKDWSDMIENNNGVLIAKKDIIIYLRHSYTDASDVTDIYNHYVYIPKNAGVTINVSLPPTFYSSSSRIGGFSLVGVSFVVSASTITINSISSTLYIMAFVEENGTLVCKNVKDTKNLSKNINSGILLNDGVKLYYRD